MHLFSEKTVSALLSLFFIMILFNSTAAQDKPDLSEAIRETINSQGVNAAKEHFTSMSPSERAQYNVDMEGISELTNAYLEEGNMDALMAISEISAPFMQDMVQQSMEQYAPEMEAMAEQQDAEQDEDVQQREEEIVREREQGVIERQGQPRDDLERFKGVYGNPDDPESTRQLWVNVSCDGYLVSGAMWGDASPWWLQSQSDNVFTFENDYSNIQMEFGNSSNGFEMIHNLEFMESPLQRVGSLPGEWDSCIERYR